MVTAGGNQAFLNVALGILDPGDEVILPVPYYFNHEMAITMVNARPVLVPTDSNYQLDLGALRAAITPRTRAIVTVSPDNPSGAVYPETTLRAVNALCAGHGIYHITVATRPTNTSPSTTLATSRRRRFLAHPLTRFRYFLCRRLTCLPAGALAGWSFPQSLSRRCRRFKTPLLYAAGDCPICCCRRPQPRTHIRKGEGPRARGDARNGASPTSYSGKGRSNRRQSCVRCSVLHPTPAVATETAGVCDAPDPRTRSRTDPGRRFWPRGRVPPPNRLWRPATCHCFGGHRALGRRRASTAGLSLFISCYT